VFELFFSDMVRSLRFPELFAFGFASKGRLVVMPMKLGRFAKHLYFAENRDYQMVNRRSRPVP
jgi:hypothetical protein